MCCLLVGEKACDFKYQRKNCWISSPEFLMPSLGTWVYEVVGSGLGPEHFLVMPIGRCLVTPIPREHHANTKWIQWSQPQVYPRESEHIAASLSWACVSGFLAAFSSTANIFSSFLLHVCYFPSLIMLAVAQAKSNALHEGQHLQPTPIKMALWAPLYTQTQVRGSRC